MLAPEQIGLCQHDVLNPITVLNLHLEHEPKPVILPFIRYHSTLIAALHDQPVASAISIRGLRRGNLFHYDFHVCQDRRVKIGSRIVIPSLPQPVVCFHTISPDFFLIRCMGLSRKLPFSKHPQAFCFLRRRAALLHNGRRLGCLAIPRFRCLTASHNHHKQHQTQ